MTWPSAVDPSPSSFFRPNPMPPPPMATIVPVVVDTELAMTSSSRVTTCGSAADRPARKNRFTDRQASTATYSGTPVTPPKVSTATPRTMPVRSRLATTRICRRRHLSSRTPAKGPTREYGSSSTANAAATLPADVCRSGEKKNRLASAAWNAPSAACEVSRVANSRRKSRCRTTARRSPAYDIPPAYGRQVRAFRPTTRKWTGRPRHVATCGRSTSADGRGLALDLAPDELLDLVLRGLVVVLLRR